MISMDLLSQRESHNRRYLYKGWSALLPLRRSGLCELAHHLVSVLTLCSCPSEAALLPASARKTFHAFRRGGKGGFNATTLRLLIFALSTFSAAFALDFSSLVVLATCCSSVNALGFLGAFLAVFVAFFAVFGAFFTTASSGVAVSSNAATAFLAVAGFAAGLRFLGLTISLAGESGSVAFAAALLTARFTGFDGSPTTLRGRPGVAYVR